MADVRSGALASIDSYILVRAPATNIIYVSLSISHRHSYHSLLSRLNMTTQCNDNVLQTQFQSKFFNGANRFHRAMHYSAKRGLAIPCRLSVRLSVCDVGGSEAYK